MFSSDFMPLLHVHVTCYFILLGSLILPNNDVAVVRIIKSLGPKLFGCLVCRRRLGCRKHIMIRFRLSCAKEVQYDILFYVNTLPQDNQTTEYGYIQKNLSMLS
jgi:hypothetical protein